ncbi:MAG: endopeptidase La [Clostridia bacterium]|nr:endopeptidase La [Clostridia bacterium]
MNNFIEKAEAMNLPVIPLRGTVAFPAVQMNLTISRPLSLKAFGEAATGNSAVLLVAQRDASVEAPTAKDLFHVGTVCTIKQVSKTPDGGLSAVFEGVCRAKITELFEDEGYHRAAVVCKKISLGTATTLRAEAMMQEIINSLNEIQPIHPSLSDEVRAAATAIKNPGMLSDFVASSVLLNYRNKQTVLESINPLVRMERLLVLLEEEKDILSCEAEIHNTVREKVDEHHKEFFLREQMRAIQQELGEDADEIEEYTEKIERTAMPGEVREKLKKELGKLAKTPFGAAESVVLRNYLDTCLEIPWEKTTKDKLDVTAAKKVLEADHFGLDKIKTRILEYVAVRKLAPDVRNQILCLVGPPGVGKTSIAASIARALGRKYARISLGGVRDEADVRGHRKTYVGAMPGRITSALISSGSKNPVIVLDEIDKLSHDLHGDPASALLEVLDPEQNKYFRDHFVEMPLDLSDCLFIATANYYEGIPEALIDRMEIIEVKPYSRTEKLNIALRHLIPKQLKRHGLSRRTLSLTDGAVIEMIDGYTREAGVRNLERELASLFRKCAHRIAEGDCKRVVVTEKNLSEFLGKRKFRPDAESKKDAVGIVNGLAYTQTGGDLLRVEVLPMDGTGKLELTGSLGDVMKESARIAISCVRSRAEALGIPADFAAKKDLHIHFPEGAIPKDGPSAGVTMFTALVSALTGIPVRHDVAMTGEVTLHGNVLPIGGLTEKTMAAYRAGVKTVLIPRDNERDLDEIDKEAAAGLRFVLCDTVDDVLATALAKPEDTAIALPTCDSAKEPCRDIPLSIPGVPAGITVLGKVH